MEATSDRVRWSEVPAALAARVGELLGSPVVAAADQLAGYSPGVAARVGTGAGRRAFVKAAPERLGRAAELYRREAAVLSLLPAGVPVPRLLGAIGVEVDGDAWFALVTEEVDGRHPAVPPARADLVAMLDVVAAAPTARGLALPDLTDELAVEVW